MILSRILTKEYHALYMIESTRRKGSCVYERKSNRQKQVYCGHGNTMISSDNPSQSIFRLSSGQ